MEKNYHGTNTKFVIIKDLKKCQRPKINLLFYQKLQTKKKLVRNKHKIQYLLRIKKYILASK